jgi:hypothetical protein
MRDAKLLTYSNSCGILDLYVSWDRAPPSCGRIFVPSVTGAFFQKDASIFFEMADQVSSLHRLSNFHANLFPSNLFSFEIELGNRLV